MVESCVSLCLFASCISFGARRMKVQFISGREPTYTRNVVILKGLRENDMLKRIRQNQEEILYKLKKKEYEKPDQRIN